MPDHNWRDHVENSSIQEHDLKINPGKNVGVRGKGLLHVAERLTVLWHGRGKGGKLGWEIKEWGRSARVLGFRYNWTRWWRVGRRGRKIRKGNTKAAHEEKL